MKSGITASSLKECRDDEKRPQSTNGVVADTGDRLAREFDRCFFFGDLNYRSVLPHFLTPLDDHRLDADKLWTQTMLSMSDKMLALQEEEEKFLKMQQQQEAAARGRATTSGDTLCDLSIPPSASATASLPLPSPLSPSRSDPGSPRDTDISRRSQEVAKKLDRVVDKYNASFRTTPDIMKSLTAAASAAASLAEGQGEAEGEEATNSPAEIQEEQTLQMVRPFPVVFSCSHSLIPPPFLSSLSPLGS
jgi:hypothetical protein